MINLELQLTILMGVLSLKRLHYQRKME